MGQSKISFLPSNTKRPIKSLAGQRFGRLTVIGYHGKGKRRGHLWLCQCDCGNHKIKLDGNLRNGDAQSCGCLHREILVARNQSPRTTVVVDRQVQCQCLLCGKTFRAASYRVKQGKGIFCSVACNKLHKNSPAVVKSRFFSHVHIVDDTECHIWTGHRNRSGYGVFRGGQYRQSAHRAAYEFANGPIPESHSHLLVCHTCDNPSCVNPEHLFLGTTLDNMQDKMTKGRGSIGEVHGNAKLIEADIEEIRALRLSGLTLESIGQKFGITDSNVCAIVKRKAWKHI